MRSLETYPGRLQLATALLVLTALFSLGRLLQDEIALGGYGTDWGAPYDARFSALKAELRDVRTVGYISDYGSSIAGNPRMDDPSAKNDLRHFFLTRYALAPLIVVHDVNGEFVVGNFSGQPSLAEIEEREGLAVVRDFGGGVVLFLRRP